MVVFCISTSISFMKPSPKTFSIIYLANTLNLSPLNTLMIYCFLINFMISYSVAGLMLSLDKTSAGSQPEGIWFSGAVA